MSLVSEPGAEVDAREWQACEQLVVGRLGRGEALLCSGSLPPGALVDGYARLARRARREGSLCILDAGGPPLAAVLEEACWRKARPWSPATLSRRRSCFAGPGHRRSTARTIGRRGRGQRRDDSCAAGFGLRLEDDVPLDGAVAHAVAVAAAFVESPGRNVAPGRVGEFLRLGREPAADVNRSGALAVVGGS
jgi:hypothetical protein